MLRLGNGVDHPFPKAHKLGRFGTDQLEYGGIAYLLLYDGEVGFGNDRDFHGTGGNLYALFDQELRLIGRDPYDCELLDLESVRGRSGLGGLPGETGLDASLAVLPALLLLDEEEFKGIAVLVLGDDRGVVVKGRPVLFLGQNDTVERTTGLDVVRCSLGPLHQGIPDIGTGFHLGCLLGLIILLLELRCSLGEDFFCRGLLKVDPVLAHDPLLPPQGDSGVHAGTEESDLVIVRRDRCGIEQTLDGVYLFDHIPIVGVPGGHHDDELVADESESVETLLDLDHLVRPDGLENRTVFAFTGLLAHLADQEVSVLHALLHQETDPELLLLHNTGTDEDDEIRLVLFADHGDDTGYALVFPINAE